MELLALGGPKNFEWLPWDGEQDTLKVPETKPFFDENEPFKLNPIETHRYQVYTIGDFKKHTARRVYVSEDIPSPREAKVLLMEHLLEKFIEVGDPEE